MKTVWERCVGLDIGKTFLVACLLTPDQGGKPDIRTFGTTTAELVRLRDWMVEERVQAAAMESTGSFWKPIWNVLEEVQGLTLTLNHPQHMKAVPGRKSDVKDAEWLADLLKHGLLRSSYVPSREQRELRELERYRRKIIGERASEVNRIQKVLEGANIKLGSVLSDVTGASGTRVLEQLSKGVDDPAVLASLMHSRVKASREELEQALTGYMMGHQRFLLGQQLDHLHYLDKEIERLDAEIARRLEPAKKVLERLQTIPGVAKRTAQVIVTEVGTDVSHFPSAAHLVAWGGLAPGQNESAGKRKPVRVRPGNATLRAAMVEVAQAAAHTRDTHLRARYVHLAVHLKGKKAVVALARHILEIIFHILRDATVYEDHGSDYYLRRNRTSIERRAIQQLQSLGYKVILEQPPAA